MLRRSVVLGGVLGLACAARGLPEKQILKPFDVGARDFPLKSGLRVLVQEDHTDPVVVVASVYGAGGTSDPEGREGLAHFVEHLAFRARPGGGPQVWDTLKRVGASFNASTSADTTSYYAVAHKDELETLMQVEALRLLDTVAQVTPEVFNTEREVVRNELRQRRETTIGNKVFDLVLQALFPRGHPLHRPLAGTHESLSAITLADAVTFARRHYRPENCTVVIAGDVDRGQVAKLLGTWPKEALFGPGGPDGAAVPPRRRPSETDALPVPPPAATQLERHKGPVPQPQLVIAWSVPGAHRGNDAFLSFATGTLNAALGQGLELDEDDDIEGVGAGPILLNHASVMMVQASLKPGADPERARKRILDSLANAWRFDDEIGDVLNRLSLNFSKWFAATALFLESDDLVTRALAASEFLAATGKTSYYSETFQEIGGVQSRPLGEFAYRWLTRDRAVSIFFEPETAEMPKVLSGTEAPAASITKRSGHDVGTGASETAAQLGPERILRVARPPGLGKLDRFTLPNGLEVVAGRRGLAPVARIAVGLHGGDAHVKPFGMAGLSRLFAYPRCRDHGSLGPVGGSIGSGGGLTNGRVFVDVPSGNLANGIAVLSDYVSCLEVSDERFLLLEQILKRRKKSYDRLVKRPEFLASRTLWAELYPDHPYGQVAVDPTTLARLSFEQAAAFVREQFRPGNALAVVLGDVDPAEVRQLAGKHLGRWQGGGSLPLGPPPPTRSPEARKVFLVDRPGASQAVVQIGCRLPAVTPETLPTFDLARHILNEEAWALREQWGATYGVSAAAQVLPGAAHIVFGGAVENPQLGTSLLRLLKILDKVGTAKTDEETFLVKRWDLAREFSRRFSGSQAVAAAILQAADQGWPIDVWDRYPAHLAATTRESVADMFKGCVGREIVTVVGDAAGLGPQIAAVGLPVER